MSKDEVTNNMPQGAAPKRNYSFRGQHLIGEDFSGLRIGGFSAVGSRFENCCFDQTSIGGLAAGMGPFESVFVECSFDEAWLASVSGFARFENCSFEKTIISGWDCCDSEIVGCRFTGLIRNAVFDGTVSPQGQLYLGRTKNECETNDFSQASLVNCVFRGGVDLTKQALPAGPAYVYVSDAQALVRRARQALERCDDSYRRTILSSILRKHEEYVASGQQQFLLRLADYPIATQEHYREQLNELFGL